MDSPILGTVGVRRVRGGNEVRFIVLGDAEVEVGAALAHGAWVPTAVGI